MTRGRPLLSMRSPILAPLQGCCRIQSFFDAHAQGRRAHLPSIPGYDIRISSFASNAQPPAAVLRTSPRLAGIARITLRASLALPPVFAITLTAPSISFPASSSTSIIETFAAATAHAPGFCTPGPLDEVLHGMEPLLHNLVERLAAIARSLACAFECPRFPGRATVTDRGNTNTRGRARSMGSGLEHLRRRLLHLRRLLRGLRRRRRSTLVRHHTREEVHGRTVCPTIPATQRSIFLNTLQICS
jgi:hypothetical protein